MLESISLWNIGGIRHAELNFPTGLTVITGESGAGKSSVVRALELAVGGRATVQMIRAGENEGITEARFCLSAGQIGNLHFDELDDALQPDSMTGELLARRTLSAKGRSRASLQGIQTPLSTYSLAATRLMHIQSQFAQMELLDTDRQLAMIDSCTTSKIRASAIELRQTFDAAREIDQERRKLSRRRASIEQSYANADTVLALVRKVAPCEGLEAKLDAELAAVTRRIVRREKAQEFLDRLTGGLSEQGLLEDTRNALESLLDFLPEDRQSKNELQQAALDALRALGDVTAAAQDVLGGEQERDADQQEQERIESRLGAVRRLKRLSNTTSEAELLDYCAAATENLEWLEKSYTLLEDLTRQSNGLKIRANALARELRHGRHDAAAFLEKGVNSLLSDLAMPATTFEVHFHELNKLRRTGADEVELALRDGERVGRVDKIASGGELSRLLLALQLSLPDEWLPPTLVFDEVEAGLGGRAAVLSGLKLKELSQRCQVILVTHEASIAALGDFHILVQRIDGETKIRPIDGEERVQEIARMLSGSPDMTEAQEHARILLSQP